MTQADPMPITRLAPWYGAKANKILRGRIITELGTDHRGYFEGCCGSLAVLLSKPPVSMEVACDLNGDLINLARVLMSDRWEDLCDRCARTLLASDTFVEMRELWASESESIIAPAVDLVAERHVRAAYRFLVASWQGVNGVTGTGRGWRVSEDREPEAKTEGVCQVTIQTGDIKENDVLRARLAACEKHLRWIAYELIGKPDASAVQVLDEIVNSTRAWLFELSQPQKRVKHDWTGQMGTVLMECEGTAFVRWDDGSVTSVYSRHLQVELQ